MLGLVKLEREPLAIRGVIRPEAIDIGLEREASREREFERSLAACKISGIVRLFLIITGKGLNSVFFFNFYLLKSSLLLETDYLALFSEAGLSTMTEQSLTGRPLQFLVLSFKSLISE